MHSIIDEKFWLAISFVAFVVLIYKFVWPILSKMIGDKADQIIKDLNDAKAAKQKAEELLVKIQKQHDTSIESAKKIINDAQIEAKKFIEDSKAAVEDEIQRKLNALNDRIKGEEEKTVRDIKAKIISLAIKSAKEGLQDVDKDKLENVIKKSIDDVSKIIH